MYNVSGLQKTCDALIENPSWSIAHLVAFFNLTELVANPKVLDLIDYSDHNNCMTPFQVSVVIIISEICRNYRKVMIIVLFSVGYQIVEPRNGQNIDSVVQNGTP